jgi:hypothetical protein
VPGRARERLFRALLLLGSVALVLGGLEAAARVARSGQGGGKEANEPKQYNEYDPLLGWRKKPGARVTYRRREYTVEVAVNSLGLRDPERGYQAPAGTQRVLALGDSFLEGYTVPLADTVTQVLERQLRAPGCAVDVINGGTQAYSTDQELLFYRSEGVKYAPRVVLLFIYYNDVLYNDRQEYFQGPKPIFEMGGGALRLHRFPVRRPRPEETPAEPPAEERSAGGSAALEWLRDRLWYGAPRAYNALARVGLWPPMPRVPIRLELRVYERRPVADIEDAWAKTALILKALNEEVRGRGASLLLVGIPARFEVDDRSWRLTQTLYGIDERTWDRGRMMARLGQIAGQEHVPFLDLTAALRAAPEPAYFTYDGHWTRAGHAAAAGAVRDALRTQHWLPGCE